MLNSVQNGRSSLIFTTLLVHATTPTFSTKNQFLNSANFQLPISPLLVPKTILTTPTNTLFLYTYFCIQPSLQSSLKLFLLPQPFTQYTLTQGTNEQGSLVRTDTVLISVFFLEVWTGKVWLIITDFLSLRLRNWWCIEGSNLWWRCLWSEWQTVQSTFSNTVNLLALLPYLTNIIIRNSHSPWNQCLTWFSS